MRTIDGDAFSDWLKEYGQEYIHGKKKISLMYIWKHVQDMPTITPERKRGRWVPQDHNKKNGMITTTVYYCPTCSVCGKTGDYNMSFCPNCGADMRGKADGG